jgi:tetratricopeptide (TPR) repeat protein
MTPVQTAHAPVRDNEVPAGLRQSAEADRPGGQSDPRAASTSSLSTASSKSALLESAYLEYARRRESGEPPHIEAYCARFSPCRSSLRRLLQTYEFINTNPDYVTGRLEECLAQAGGRHGDLTLIRELGRGSFARVYLATEASTGDRLVAVKFSLDDGAEARTMGRLSHPHVVPILSARREESTGLTMVCMPYLGSATLEDVLDGAFPVPEAPRPRKASVILDVLRQCAQPEDPPAGPPHKRLQTGSYADGVIHLAISLAEALAFLHHQGICHRDLKPSNVLLDPSGKPLLLDFNLSASAREAALETGGTLRYMPPEHIRAYLREDADELDERADLFALGVIVYELLTGDHPYGPIPAALTGPELAQFLLGRLESGFRPLRKVCPELMRPVAAVLDRCLAVDPADRPRSAAELAAQLKRQFSPARRTRRWVAAHPRLTAIVLCLLTFTAAAGSYSWSAYPGRQFQLGKAAFQAGDFDGAEKYFDRAVRRDPENLGYRRARGCARLQQSKFLPGGTEEQRRVRDEKLDQAWDDLKPTEPGLVADPQTLAVFAYIMVRKQQFQPAIRMYNQLDKTEYRPLMVYNNRAYARMGTSELRQASQDLDKAAKEAEAVQGDAKSQAVYCNRMLLAWQNWLVDPKSPIPLQALDDFEHALRLGPATPAFYHYGAYLYAQVAYQDLSRVPVSFRAPIATALHCQRRQQRIDRAISCLREAIAGGESPQAISQDDFLKNSLGSRLDSSAPSGKEAGRKSQPVSPPQELQLIVPAVLPD